MNQYFVAVQDGFDEPYPFIKSITAKSFSDCQDKLVRWIYDYWSELDFSTEDYVELRKEIWQKYNIRIGAIQEFD